MSVIVNINIFLEEMQTVIYSYKVLCFKQRFKTDRGSIHDR